MIWNIFLISFIFAECPEKWLEYGSNQKCYKAFESGAEAAWTSAESTCQTFGGDLVSFENEGEKNFVYEKVINRRSYDYYWTGLNDLHKAGSYEWIQTDGTNFIPVSWTFWSDGLDPVGHNEPSTNTDKRCTFALFSDHLPADYGHEGKWVKGKCEEAFKYVCKVDQSKYVKECDDGFVKLPGQEDYCYQHFPDAVNRQPWDRTRDSCLQEYGAQLLEIFNDQQEAAIQKWLRDEISKTEGYKGVWLGLTDMEHDGRMYSVIQNTEPNYQNWAYGEPDLTYQGTRCGYIGPTGGPWEILRCGVNCGKGRGLFQ